MDDGQTPTDGCYCCRCGAKTHFYRHATSMSVNNKNNSDALPQVLNPCDNVRRSCRWVMQENPHVQVNQQGLQQLAQSVHDKIQSQDDKFAEWDAEEWHYTGNNYKGSNDNKRERIALYVLALDAMNFCFWPNPENDESKKNNSLEYEHLATALTTAAQQDDSSDDLSSYVLSPTKLAAMTEQEFVSLLKPHLQGHYLPNTAERVRLWNELGCGLLHHYGGSALQLVEKAKGHAPTLVSRITSHFPGFRDESLYMSNAHGSTKQICFYKRAQIAVGDLNAALGLQLEGMDQLTMFADYRVPQLLRHLGVLVYINESLSQTIDSGTELSANSSEEVSIRAATIVAVEQLVQLVFEQMNENSEGKQKVMDVTMDWYLWQMGEALHQEGRMKPHHKTRTIFY